MESVADERRVAPTCAGGDESIFEGVCLILESGYFLSTFSMSFLYEWSLLILCCYSGQEHSVPIGFKLFIAIYFEVNVQ